MKQGENTLIDKKMGHPKKNLVEDEMKFRDLFENVPIGISMTDMNGVMFANQAFCNMLGYSAQEMQSKKWMEITHPEDVLPSNEATKSVLNGSLPQVRFEKRYIHKNGSVVFADVVIYLHRTSDGLPQFFITTINDITKRKEAEEKVRQSEELYRAVINNLPITIYATDDKGIFTLSEGGGLKGTGLKPGDNVGVSAYDLFAQLPIYLDDGSTITGTDVLNKTLSGTSFSGVTKAFGKIFDNRFIPLTSDKGTIVGMLGITLDITERSKSEEQLKQELIERKKAEQELKDAIERSEKNKKATLNLMQDIKSEIEDRKQKEENLRVQEERLRLSLLAGKQGLFDLNIQTGDAIVSQEYATMLGYDPTTFVETNARWLERIHPDDKERTAQAYRDYIAGKRTEYRVEFRQKMQSGEWKWILSMGKVVSYSENGEPLRMLGTHTDIDLLKRVQEMQILQTTALESAANGIVITDMEGKIVWANPSFSRITGYSLDEAIGAKPNILKSGKHSKEFYATIWNTIISGQTWSGSIINKRKDGTLYEDEMTITPVRNEHNIVTHFVAVKQDVTERNKNLRQIREQALFLDEAHDAIIVRDTENVVVYWNKGAEMMFGWSSEEAIGKDIRSLIYSDLTNFKNEMEKVLNTGNYAGEAKLTTKLKKEIFADVRLNLITDEDGKPKSILSISNDITDQKLIETQLLRAQRLESLGTLAGGIAHDLNNVLAPILLAIEFFKRTYVNESSQKMLESVESSARRGSEIVKQILAFARGLESKKASIQPRHLVDEIVKVFKETFPRSISVINNIPKNISPIIADPTQFHQLIMNLGVNARDAMPNGGTLTIDAHAITIDEQYAKMNINAHTGLFVHFVISDTGTGMTPEVFNHIFEPFFTTKEIGKGTGLGLATVHTIVKAHDGFIDVKSEVGKGTTFNIYIPAAEGAILNLEKKKDKTHFLGNGELILVVDDERSIREVTKQTLELSNYTVITATDGADAIGLFAEQKHNIALVVTDMMMPLMDGYQLIMALQKMDPNTKIIASSGLIDKQNINVHGFLEKPYSAEKLLEEVKKVLKGKMHSKI